MNQISQHNNYTNNSIHYDDKMRKMIDNLVSKKGDGYDDSSPKANDLHSYLLMHIVHNPKKDVYQTELNKLESKVRTASVNYSYLLFSCSINAMYIREFIILKSNVSC